MGSSLVSAEFPPRCPGSLWRLGWRLCYGFVTAPTSIPSPFYRDVTGVTALEGGEEGHIKLSMLCYVSKKIRVYRCASVGNFATLKQSNRSSLRRYSRLFERMGAAQHG